VNGLNQLYSYFPLMITAAAFTAFAVFAAWPSGWTVFLLLFALYLLPPIVHRIIVGNRIKPGIATIDDRTFSPWLASHHIQAFYNALPFLEALLRVIPGFYSAWLRLWGSRIGYGVEWDVSASILDRSLMDIGNRVVFAREVELAAHVRKKTEGGASRVLVRPVRIGAYAFLGAGVHAGAGAHVPNNASVPPQAIVNVNETFGDAVRHPDRAEAEFSVV
jgi:acetyltransferase-like isoleucine patch superfamily enzyme